MSAFLAVVMILGTLPVMNVFAAQKSDYEDPADNWLKTNNRTNELDMNATVTYETQWCPVCNKHTTVLTYRVPEYTKSGQTAMNHGVKWSDGYDIDALEQELDPNKFFRINRQYIANIKGIKKISMFFSSKLIVRIKGCKDNNIIISKEKSAQFKKWLDR